MEVHQRHISSDEDRLLELMEHGAGPDKALLDALRDDDSLRQDCMDVLELSSACRRSKEHPDAEAALREFHQQHGARTLVCRIAVGGPLPLACWCLSVCRLCSSRVCLSRSRLPGRPPLRSVPSQCFWQMEIGRCRSAWSRCSSRSPSPHSRRRPVRSP